MSEVEHSASDRPAVASILIGVASIRFDWNRHFKIMIHEIVVLICSHWIFGSFCVVFVVRPPCLFTSSRM